MSNSERVSVFKKVLKKDLNKNLVMSDKEEEQLQLSNTYWIREKLIDDDDEKVSDQCRIIGNLKMQLIRVVT